MIRLELRFQYKNYKVKTLLKMLSKALKVKNQKKSLRSYDRIKIDIKYIKKKF